ncbi:complex I intermediate-associated CIA30 protein, mitochondrial [Volvox carteri f. nagariensis]|uniref:Complex I intermediate-associated CIA30 protein, mitochondrial n=1 Tax=Volvox carteri f. nagariensis TaxID=3068 RepID=D8TYK1_VOLCA|nr:complex I intermediate-associated CIA30 protein, mitochondrial [Volvox carteri f. nagariensis]EFJ47324.1 complex I intermediate-associated CIA30 protein, mitochondrial [Volvox carteri f. nagariensis]|eukprot:XP_002951513.1 complex I intermediate-associated CIA30 protein, mitochondrial [Volvox carteri f. nagariensis]
MFLTIIIIGTVDLTPEPKVLYAFKTQRDVAAWNVFSDASFGGLSKATFHLSESGKLLLPQTAVFSGTYSKEVLEDSKLIRSGYCGINQVRSQPLNLRKYDFLDIRLRGDGNTYLANIRLDQLTGGDEEVWQATLKTSPGAWQDVRLDFRDFVFTFRGRLVTHYAPTSVGMPRHNIISFGITMAASEDMAPGGNFSLELESLRAGAYKLSDAAAARKAYAGYFEFREPRGPAAGGCPAWVGTQLVKRAQGRAPVYCWCTSAWQRPSLPIVSNGDIKAVE